MRKPTVKQARLIMVLSSGAIALAPSRADWGPLIRREWVEPISEDDKDKRFLPPVRVTADGLRALADAMDRYPDELRPVIKRHEFPQLNESPEVTRLKESLATARSERDEARRGLAHARGALSRCQSTIGQVLDAG